MRDPKLARRDRAALTLVFIVAGGCGVLYLAGYVVDALTASVSPTSDATERTSPSPPETPSATTWTDEARLDWLINDGWTAVNGVNTSCFALAQCTNLTDPGTNGAPLRPEDIAPCIDRQRPGCAAVHDTIANGELAPPPSEFEAFLNDLGDDSGATLCYADTHRRMVAEHPEVIRQLRTNRELASGPLRDSAPGWESLESWAREPEEPRPAWAADFVAAYRACDEQWPESYRPHFGEVTAWLRERYDCTPVGGACTLERVREMVGTPR